MEGEPTNQTNERTMKGNPLAFQMQQQPAHVHWEPMFLIVYLFLVVYFLGTTETIYSLHVVDLLSPRNGSQSHAFPQQIYLT